MSNLHDMLLNKLCHEQITHCMILCEDLLMSCISKAESRDRIGNMFYLQVREVRGGFFFVSRLLGIVYAAGSKKKAKKTH